VELRLVERPVFGAVGACADWAGLAPPVVVDLDLRVLEDSEPRVAFPDVF